MKDTARSPHSRTGNKKKDGLILLYEKARRMPRSHFRFKIRKNMERLEKEAAALGGTVFYSFSSFEEWDILVLVGERYAYWSNRQTVENFLTGERKSRIGYFRTDPETRTLLSGSTGSQSCRTPDGEIYFTVRVSREEAGKLIKAGYVLTHKRVPLRGPFSHRFYTLNPYKRTGVDAGRKDECWMSFDEFVTSYPPTKPRRRL